MEGIYLLLGSNQGDKRANITLAKELIVKKIGEIAAISSIYQTEPWGKKDQDDFLNQAVLVKTTLEPLKLLNNIEDIESEIGKNKTEKWGERKIDIDILYYGNQIIQKENLEIPHPEIPERRFTLVPLVEIAPSFKNPLLSKSNKEMLQECSDQSWVKKVTETD